MICDLMIKFQFNPSNLNEIRCNLMKISEILFLLAVQLTLTNCIDYLNQNSWSGSCNEGANQSPIDIPCQQYLNICPPAKGYLVYWQNPVLQFGASHYQDIKTYLPNNSWVRFSNETNDYIFKSAQFHLHQPSEHTVNGVSYPLEIHFVHVLDDPVIKEYLVIGILFEVDATLEYDIFDSVKIDSNTTFTHLFPFALTNKPAYHYRGSLTTPPCTAAVNWFLQTEPVKIRQENMDRITERVGEGHANNRLIQRLGSRPVFVVGQGC